MPLQATLRRRSVGFSQSTESYFDTLGIALVGGRAFNGSDNGNNQLAVIVNERLARETWPGLASHALATSLYQISALDRPTFFGAALTLAAVALLALLPPAARASRVAPMTMLRQS